MRRNADRARPEPSQGDLAAARAEMVERQLRPRGVTDERVLAAMGSVPRERFVEPEMRPRAYQDAALPSRLGQTISQPLMVGLMTQLLAADPGAHVLEIGTGTGYQAAVLAAMGCRVTTLERLPALADAARATLDSLSVDCLGPDVFRLGDLVEIRVADGTLGAADGAPWQRILVTAGAPHVPAALVAQLAVAGRLVIPVGARWEQELLLVERDRDEVRTSRHGACVFVPLIGADAWAGNATDGGS